MGEVAPDPTATLVQVRAAAQAFAAGDDGSALLPAELRAAAAVWRRRLQHEGQVLDSEAWLLGLLTLRCLSQPASSPMAESSEPCRGANTE